MKMAAGAAVEGVGTGVGRPCLASSRPSMCGPPGGRGGRAWCSARRWREERRPGNDQVAALQRRAVVEVVLSGASALEQAFQPKWCNSSRRSAAPTSR